MTVVIRMMMGMVARLARGEMSRGDLLAEHVGHVRVTCMRNDERIRAGARVNQSTVRGAVCYVVFISRQQSRLLIGRGHRSGTCSGTKLLRTMGRRTCMSSGCVLLVGALACVWSQQRSRDELVSVERADALEREYAPAAAARANSMRPAFARGGHTSERAMRPSSWRANYRARCERVKRLSKLSPKNGPMIQSREASAVTTA